MNLRFQLWLPKLVGSLSLRWLQSSHLILIWRSLQSAHDSVPWKSPHSFLLSHKTAGKGSGCRRYQSLVCIKTSWSHAKVERGLRLSDAIQFCAAISDPERFFVNSRTSFSKLLWNPRTSFCKLSWNRVRCLIMDQTLHLTTTNLGQSIIVHAIDVFMLLQYCRCKFTH